MKDNIIKGPWTRVVKITPEENQQVREDIEFVEELAENILINAITSFQENGFDVNSETLRMYIPFLNECVRAICYKDMGYKHILNDLIEKLMTEKGVDNSLDISYHSVNIEKVKELIEET
tara:strand:- start:3274 stop:3633 length:360 start_codon:yes stop_codon:yes gene_type:complete